MLRLHINHHLLSLGKLMRSLPTAALVCALTAGAAHAEVVVFDYTAVVDRTAVSIGANSQDVSSISVGDSIIAPGYTFHGYFTVDLDTRTYDYRPEHGPNVQYRDADSDNRAGITVDQTGHAYHSYVQPYLSRFHVMAGPTSHTFEHEAVNLTSGPGWQTRSEYLWLQLTDADARLLGPYGSAPASLDFAQVDSSRLIYGFSPMDSDEYVDAYATLTSLTLRQAAPVPEPETWAMLGLGLLALGAAARRPPR